MQLYRYICRTQTSGHSWQVEATFPSHAMALEYGSKIAKDFIHCPWFMSLDVWLVENEAGSYVGSISLAENICVSIVKAA